MTILRPVAQVISSHAINVVGTGSVITAVTDNSDSTYIQAQVANQYIRFTLGDISITGTQRVKSVNVRVRTARDGAGGSTQDTQTSMNSSTAAHTGACAFIAPLIVARGLTSITTATGPLVYSGPCKAALTQTVVNDLQIQVKWYAVHSGASAFQRVYELYADVDVNNQPQVTGVTASNFTNNATPTIAWNWVDFDDDVQVHWRVKIFDAATIAAGNFSPDTSVAFWDSLDQTGQDASTVVQKPLLNGVSYTAYVEAAQSWPGPQGSLWWSAWATSSPFTVTFTPPPTPVINSALVLAENNQYRAMLNVLVPFNLLTADNASFEGSIGQWAGLTNCSVSRTTLQAADGLASMAVTGVGSGDMVARCALDPIGDPRIDGGQTYTALAQFKTAVTARSCQVGLEWLDSTGATISTVFGSSVTDSTANFNTQAVFTAAAPTNARQARIEVKVLAVVANEVHFVDKIDVHAGTTTTWSPGGFSNDQGDLVIERGEYLVDDRGPAENWFHPQVASAGSVLQNQGYGFFIDTTQGTLTWRWLDKTIPEIGDTPPGMLDWNPGTATTPSIAFGAWFYGGTAYMVPVVQGQTHIFSCWAWVNTGTMQIIPRFDWRNEDGTVLGTTAGGTFTLTTTPQRIFVTGTPTAGAKLACGAAQNNTSDAGKHVYFTRLGFGLGTIPVDGKRAKGQPTGISVTGAPIGLGWTQIRSTKLAVPTTILPPGFITGQVETFPDYEYAGSRPTLYRASIAYSTGGNVIRSPYSAQTVVYATPPPVTLLRSLTNSTLQVAVNRRKQATRSIIEDATVFHPLGANAGPVRVRDWVGGEDGQLIVITSTESQFARLQALLYASEVLQLQWAQGGRTYVSITDRSYDETISADLDFCDAEGGALQTWIRYAITTLTYVETTAS